MGNFLKQIIMDSRKIQAIAYIENDFKQKFGIPRQSGRANSVISKIVFYPEYRTKDAFRGLEQFSHLWLIFDFSLAHTDTFTPLVRPPRLGGNKKVGVFASRSPFRPNSLGLSSVKIEQVVLDQADSPYILVSGADLMDKTPIYDIKPYLPQADCHTDAKGSYSDNEWEYKLEVVFCDKLKSKIPADKLQGLIECLADDPRPSYQDDEREYGMFYSNYNIKFIVKDKTLTVIDVENI